MEKISIISTQELATLFENGKFQQWVGVDGFSDSPFHWNGEQGRFTLLEGVALWRGFADGREAQEWEANPEIIREELEELHAKGVPIHRYHYRGVTREGKTTWTPTPQGWEVSEDWDY